MVSRVFRRMVPVAAGLALGVGVLGAPASAQFGGGLSSDFESTVDTGRKFGPFYGSVAVYPIAVFVNSGTDAEGASGTSYDFGRLTSLDFGFRPPRSRTPLEFGGWFWGRGSDFNLTQRDNDQYQLHARVWFTTTRQLGLQVAMLDSTRIKPTSQRPDRPDFRAYTAFLLYEFRSLEPSPDRQKRWVVTTGVGFLRDATPLSSGSGRFEGKSTSEFTTFVQAALFFDKSLSLNLSEWYIRDREQDLNRFALGLGYKF